LDAEGKKNSPRDSFDGGKIVRLNPRLASPERQRDHGAVIPMLMDGRDEVPSSWGAGDGVTFRYQ